MALPPLSTGRAVVTGASQGIGMAMARDLAHLGYDVTLVARRRNVLEEFAAELPGSPEVFPCDLSDAAQRKQFNEYLRTTDVAVLVNSAGIASFGPFMKQDWVYETQQFELNASAVFEATRAVLPQMLERGKGAICNVGSAAGDVVIPNNATYIFTKAGVNAFTEALHYELQGTGVHCTLLAPGPVREAHIPEEQQSIVDKVVPDFLWTTYESCSQETLRAMSANKRRVVPGPLSKFGSLVGRALPTALSAPLIGSFYAKMGE